jgi:hypothetical protein
MAFPAGGFSGEYGQASSALLSSPDDGFTRNGDVYISDTSNSCVRLVE